MLREWWKFDSPLYGSAHQSREPSIGVLPVAIYHRGLRSFARKLSPVHLAQAVQAVSEDTILVDWVHRGPVKENWGDAIAPLIVGRLSGKRVVNQRDVLNPLGRTVYTTIGSMLGTIDAKRVVVWGSGFVHSELSLRCRPEEVRAVRGPLTRQKLLDAKVPCPELFGDPALLFPLLYQPDVEREHRLGIIPHFKEIDLPAVTALERYEGVSIIDIRGGIESVVDEINKCDYIASSSLHGLVCADAYGIPAIWITFSDLPGGDGFKFRDYLLSTDSRHNAPLRVTTSTSINEIENQFEDVELSVDLDAFLNSCPFLDRSRFEPVPRSR